MIFKRGPFEIEFEWDHGPDLTIIVYGHRTHILSASWSAYPVLGGAEDHVEPLPEDGWADDLVPGTTEAMRGDSTESPKGSTFTTETVINADGVPVTRITVDTDLDAGELLSETAKASSRRMKAAYEAAFSSTEGLDAKGHPV